MSRSWFSACMHNLYRLCFIIRHRLYSRCSFLNSFCQNQFTQNWFKQCLGCRLSVSAVQVEWQLFLVTFTVLCLRWMVISTKPTPMSKKTDHISVNSRCCGLIWLLYSVIIIILNRSDTAHRLWHFFFLHNQSGIWLFVLLFGDAQWCGGSNPETWFRSQ